MPIPVQNNGHYGGILINQKYSPLAVNAVPMPVGDQPEYVTLFQGRRFLLDNQHLFPGHLNLYAENWNLIQTNETAPGALPPIVVVSSGRAQWILDTYNNAAQIQAGNYANVNDVAALVAGATPWYLPQRINDANRHVYILVHRLEYDYYRLLLGATQMTVVGWSFEPNMNIMAPDGSIIGNSYAGFGASRFAAVEFCKYIFNQPIIAGAAVPPVAAANQKAWLVDDNVAYVRGFPGFAACDAVLNAAIWALGFSGATVNSPDPVIMQLVAPPVLAGLAALQPNGLIQQCVALNINQLNAQFLNYSPYFLNSNEDTSFSNFLQNQAASRLRICTGAAIFKGVPTNSHGEGGAGYVSLLRQHAAQTFYDVEQNYQVAAPANQGGVQQFNNYIINHVLPNAFANMQTEDPVFTEGKAIEQVMARVVNDHINWVPPWVFRPNGMAAQIVHRF